LKENGTQNIFRHSFFVLRDINTQRRITDNPKKTNERQMTGQNQLRKTDRTEKLTCQKTAMILSQGSCPKDENQYAL